MIDKRHASRSVRCVVWKKTKNGRSTSSSNSPYSIKSPSSMMRTSNIFMMDEDDIDEENEDGDGDEKFALKMIMRRKNIKSNLNEKDIMLAMDSEWHTKLINT